MTNMQNVIQTTTEYKQFNYLKHNRRVLEYHVRDLMASFREHPHLRPTRPVLLNEKYEIIDGQHRFEAAKRMKIEVYYMVVPGLTIADARLLNALQRTGSLLDYAESYASDGHKEYQALIDKYEEYKIPVMALVIYMSGRSDQGQRTSFKLGKFKRTDVKITEKYLNQLQDFSAWLKTWNEDRFATAAFVLFNNENYDHKRMMEKMSRQGRLNRQPSRLEYIRALEDIYNTDTNIKNRVRFF